MILYEICGKITNVFLAITLSSSYQLLYEIIHRENKYSSFTFLIEYSTNTMWPLFLFNYHWYVLNEFACMIVLII